MHLYIDDYKAAIWGADDYCTCAATRRNQHEPSCPWLSPNERLVALAHCFYATWADGGDCRPGAAKIAKRTGLSARSIHEIRASLVRKGWMVLEHRGGAPMGSRREANVYALVVPDVDTQGTSFTGEVPSLVKRTPSTSEAGAPTSEAGAPTSEAGGTPPPLTSSDLLKNPPPASWRSPSGMDDQDTRTTDDPQEPLDPFEEDVAHARAAAASWPGGRGGLDLVALPGGRVDVGGALAGLDRARARLRAP